MKKIAILFLIFNARYLWATEFRTLDGRVEFAVAKVDGEIAWTEVEKTKMTNDRMKIAVGTITAYSPTVESLTPAKYEIALSTIIAEKMNSEKFASLQTKDGLFEKMRTIKSDLDLANDIGDTQRAGLLKQKYDWLKTYYKGLSK